MAVVVWTKEAIDDLSDITAYISRDSKFYAQQLVRKIHTYCSKLELFPESGRSIPEVEDDPARELIVGNYRLMYDYFPESDRVEILAVYHSARNFQGFE